MYYKGTLEQCEEYNAIVSANWNGLRWAEPTIHEGESYVIIKHPLHESETMVLIEELP